MARCLARRGIGLVYGGGNVGLMGSIADAALAEGVEVHGVIPHKLMKLELGHSAITELVVTDNMHARKAKMAELSDAFIALPGGWGTLEELFEVTTWTQLEYHHKPVGLLNAYGYYDSLLGFVAHAVEERFIRKRYEGLIQHAPEPDALVDLLASCELPRLDRGLLTNQKT